ncbi:TPA: hypothetical protein ACLQU7_005233 [Bacillus tropicus]|uniref:hypothetical protein n=1 Tax=Bacillus tropicus TaxID=2026188 RepID=UPI0004616741|nr:hypothetical protein [Bacillus tropicus]AIY72841.1 putative membrane protein [Bacillus cereus]AJI02630.1 putative membrane protein [Bacillus cereus G9241]KDB41011.1 hypothetical protein DH31_12255 [Bacillus cereus]
MITLIVIAYIIISLGFSIDNMMDRFSWGIETKGMQKKEAFIWGFLAIPIGVSGVVIIVGAVILIGGSLLWVIEWIYRNMP